MRNIVLIGMPGCGKSTVGVVLAKSLGMDFVDSDLVIQSTMGATLAQLIEQHGDDGFRDIENRVNASIDVQNSIIATGGSVVYGAEAMAHLKSIGTVVYLRLTCENITERLGDLHARGVTIKPAGRSGICTTSAARCMSSTPTLCRTATDCACGMLWRNCRRS